MRNISTTLILFLVLFFSWSVYAGGGITHMFIAEESIPLIFDTKLRHVLEDNKEAYLVGAHYPDSGYVPGTGYGEDSHWDTFIFTFAEYIKEKYHNPVLENPKLVAFLMGCATHRVSDEIIHSIFYPHVAANDFSDNYDKAHRYGDVGIDLLLNIDKGRWRHHPDVWWVPVADLLEVYHRMGKDQYTADQIILGNSVLNMAGYLERAITIQSYPYLRLRMPWTAKHYYDWPEGGMLMDIKQVAEYQNNLWQRLTEAKTKPLNKSTTPSHSDHESALMTSAKQVLENHIATMDVKHNADGSVELQPPVIMDQNRFMRYALVLE